MKLLILTQLPPTHCGILTLISSLSMVTSMQQRFFWWSFFFFSQSLWCHSRGRIWFHALKSSTVKIKTVSFYPTWTQNCDILKKSFIWNAHWCTSEALKIILIAWARCWLGGLMQKSANSQQQSTDSYFHQASWTTHWITSQGSYHLH